ncbi:TetR/AcrR family transcriptional regulator [Streptomyces murinus]|uniref:TetR/AcrR family transcriptional regulator n=1 Tax=Streptomyces murinus TaxID=33900 RepID=UPI002113C3E0|nr:TetR/AcrR family transcriptional regulator [Streptomyces murinus]
MPEAAPRRGRPRDAGRDQALLGATLAILAEGGYGGLTTAAVAARAGVSTATLYRRWSSKDDLVIAAAAAYHETLDTQPDTGSLEGDLRAVLRAKAATLTGEGGRLMQALIGEATQNTALAEALTDAFLTPVHRRVEEAVRRAVDRGEIPPVEDIELLGDVVAGPVMSRFLLTPRRPDQVDAVTAERTADRLLPFILRAVGGGA